MNAVEWIGGGVLVAVWVLGLYGLYGLARFVLWARAKCSRGRR